MADFSYEFLTDSDKNQIIVSHIKNHENTLYSLEVTRIEMMSDSVIDQQSIDAIDFRIFDVQQKIFALKNERSKLNIV